MGNVGKTVQYTLDESADGAGHVSALAAVTSDMQAGNVDTLLILGGNPVYDAPTDLDFAGGLKKVKTSIHVGLYRNETARACQWHVPQSHFLESWGDARSFDGTYSVVQPMIAPLYGGRTWSELVARLLGDTLPKPEELVRETFQVPRWGRSTARVSGVVPCMTGCSPTAPGPPRRYPSPGKYRFPRSWQRPYRETVSWNWSFAGMLRSMMGDSAITAGCKSVLIRSRS